MCLHFWRENRGGLTDEAAQEEAVIEIVLNLFFFQLSVSNFPSFDRRISQMHSMSVIAVAKGWGERGSVKEVGTLLLHVRSVSCAIS